MSHTPQQALQYTQPLAVTNTQPLAVTNTLPSILQHAISHTPHQAISHTPQQAISQPRQDENIYYVCTLCETPTKFTEYGKLEKHVRRFHSDFNQKERGNKRKGRKEEVYPKKGKWNWT